MGRWAKNHDQRKGQWLINKILEKMPNLLNTNQTYSEIWNMTNEDFEKIMEDYYK